MHSTAMDVKPMLKEQYGKAKKRVRKRATRFNKLLQALKNKENKRA